MPISDIRSDLLPQAAFDNAFTTNTTVNGSAIDTADFDGGIVFTAYAPDGDFTDGTYTLSLEQDDNSGFSSATAVPSENLISDTPPITITAGDALGGTLVSLGAFGVERFLRLVVVSTGVSTGARVIATVHKKAEISPAV